MTRNRGSKSAKKRAREYNEGRRVEDSSRKRRRAYDDNQAGSWVAEASALESTAEAARALRVTETTRRNEINQASLADSRRDRNKKTSGIDDDRARFYRKIDEPMTLICGACGTLNSVSNSRWRVLNYDDVYFSPLLAQSTYDTSRGIYTAAITSDEVTHEDRVAICDRCDLALKNGRRPKYSVASGFRIGAVPRQLAVLNSIESRLIGLGVAFTTCFRIRGSGQECTKGHSISYWNDACKIALSLPRPLAQSGVVRLHTRGAESSTGIFTVRPHLIREALVWLIANNPLYKNVTISEGEVASLQKRCDDVPSLAVDEDDERWMNNVNRGEDKDAEEATCEEETFEMQTGGATRTESDEILAAIRDKHRTDVDVHIDRPTSVINEYTTNTLMQSCFPTLFPDGMGGFDVTSFEKRDHTFDLADFCAHLMRWYDRRFVIHSNFKFFCLNLIQRRQIDGLTRRLSTQRGEWVVEDEEKEPDNSFLSRAKSLLKQLKPYFRSVRGSGLYWREVRDELMGMLGNRVLKTPYPTFFFTLSAADTIWPDFFCACDPSLTLEQASALPPDTRRRLLNENPDVASRHFYRRFKAFFDHVLLGESQPLGKIVDYFWRVEFQRRGSPHIHGLLWVEGSPDVLKQSETPEGRVSLANFLDKHIAATTFRQDTHCGCQVCTRCSNDDSVDILAQRPPPTADSQATQCDLARLVARVQQHRCFEGASCRVKTGQCRFSFPKNIQEHTTVSYDKGADGMVKFDVQCKRDDPYTNGFNPEILQVWRANMDVKLVGNAYGAAEYTAAYVSKAEPDTVKFRNAIAVALEKHPGATYLSSLRRVANASIATREVSAQEALWILQRSLPMCGKSRNVLRVKTLRHAQRYYRVDIATCLREMETFTNSEVPGPRLEPLERAYVARPDSVEFESMTYRQFCEHYEPCDEKPSSAQRLQRWPRLDGMGYIKARRSPQAVVKSPRLPADPTNADYCFSELFLHTSWRKLADLPIEDKDCENAFLALQRNESTLEAIERQHQLLLQAETGTTPPTGALERDQWTISLGFPREEADILNPADATSTLHPSEYLHSSSEYEKAENFIPLVVKPFIEERNRTTTGSAADIQKNEYQYPIDLETHNMNEEQWLPFALCMKQSRLRRVSTTQGLPQCEPLRMILNGEGGSGKSWLIRHVVKDVHKVWNELGTSVRRSKRVLLMAHHGTAAFNIKGVTICSALGLGASSGFNKKYQPLQESKTGLRTLRSLQDKYKDVQLVIIDEYSVISCAMLHWIDQRMRELWPDHRHVPFGGRDIIFAGDMGQLPSVMPASLATPLLAMTNNSQKEGRRLWTSIPLVCTLKCQQRGVDDAEWYSALSRLRNMDETEKDLRLFNSRHFAQDEMPPWTRNAIHIAYRNVDVEAANSNCLARCGQVVVEIKSTHTILPNLRSGDISQPLDSQTIDVALTLADAPDANRDRCIPQKLSLAIGVPVTLTHNLAQAAGLCNGTKGIVHDFIYSASASLPVVLVEIQDKYIGPSYLPHKANIVPIPPQTLSWLSPNRSYRTTRTGLPLRLGFAMTVHKVQGLTCPRLVFNPVAIPTSTFAYVGLSRVRHREHIVLTRALQPLKSQLQHKTREMRHAEWTRLGDLDVKTRDRTRTVVVEMKNIATLENVQ